jgi:hypothetical protein
LEDSKTDNIEFAPDGFSKMLFEVRMGKIAVSGVLCKKFFELYEEIKKKKNIPNIGWELINSKI